MLSTRVDPRRIAPRGPSVAISVIAAFIVSTVGLVLMSFSMGKPSDDSYSEHEAQRRVESRAARRSHGGPQAAAARNETAVSEEPPKQLRREATNAGIARARRRPTRRFSPAESVAVVALRAGVAVSVAAPVILGQARRQLSSILGHVV